MSGASCVLCALVLCNFMMLALRVLSGISLMGVGYIPFITVQYGMCMVTRLKTENWQVRQKYMLLQHLSKVSW